MARKLDIIIPTWNNPDYFNPCLKSILDTGILTEANDTVRLIVVNNGSQPITQQFGHLENVMVLTPGKNLGWERGLKLALDHSDAEYVCFQNDDTFIPYACRNYYSQLLDRFSDETVGMVGSSTTIAAGIQSIFSPSTPKEMTLARWVIFFCVIVPRETLNAVGGIDDSLPGGDDIDLSIRIRKAGKKIVVDPNAFIIHHAFKTGDRVYGGPAQKNGWNSLDMQEATHKALIQKHGFKEFFVTSGSQVVGPYEGERILAQVAQ